VIMDDIRRLNELKAVMAKVNGGNYRWNWDKFKIAMRNMGCELFFWLLSLRPWFNIIPQGMWMRVK
jgi:hypothetical protein